MEKFVKGDIVVVPFPFSDLSQTKKRPALVITVFSGNDIILCQITSKMVRDKYSIQLGNDDFQIGNLNQPSNIRPNRIFTAEKALILYPVGRVKSEKMTEVIDKIIEIITS